MLTLVGCKNDSDAKSSLSGSGDKPTTATAATTSPQLVRPCPTVAATAGAAWCIAASQGSGTTLIHIDTATLAETVAAKIPSGPLLQSLVVTEDHVWLSGGTEREGRPDDVTMQLEVRTGAVRKVEVPDPRRGAGRAAVALGDTTVIADDDRLLFVRTSDATLIRQLYLNSTDQPEGWPLFVGAVSPTNDPSFPDRYVINGLATIGGEIWVTADRSTQPRPVWFRLDRNGTTIAQVARPGRLTGIVIDGRALVDTLGLLPALPFPRHLGVVWRSADGNDTPLDSVSGVDTLAWATDGHQLFVSTPGGVARVGSSDLTTMATIAASSLAISDGKLWMTSHGTLYVLPVS